MMSNREPQADHGNRNLLSGLLFGIGMAAFVDEVIFHQLLQWHHFYDRDSLRIGILSDGILHAFSWFATVAGLFLFADIRRKGQTWLRRWIAAVLIGAGGFHLFDGIVNHKVFRLHQVRYEVDLLPYDIVWNAVGAAVLLAGLVLFRMTSQQATSVTPEENR